MYSHEAFLGNDPEYGNRSIKITGDEFGLDARLQYYGTDPTALGDEIYTYFSIKIS